MDLNAELIHRIAPEGAVADGRIYLDIGANHGRYSRYAYSHGLKVYAFEPEPKNMLVLQDAIKYMTDGVFPQAVALATGRGETPMYLCGANDGGHTISAALGHVAVWGHDAENFIMVPTVSLDEWVAHNLHDGSKIKGIKIDVEGAELEVLYGAWTTITTYKPLISLETHSTVNMPLLEDWVFDRLKYEIVDAYDRADQPARRDKFKIDVQYLLAPKA